MSPHFRNGLIFSVCLTLNSGCTGPVALSSAPPPTRSTALPISQPGTLVLAYPGSWLEAHESRNAISVALTAFSLVLTILVLALTVVL